MTKVKQEKNFVSHCPSSKCRENFHGFCFICIGSAKESHCSIEHSLGKPLWFIENLQKLTAKLFSCLTFAIYSRFNCMYVC